MIRKSATINAAVMLVRRAVTGFLFIPTVTALCGVVLAIIAVQIDRTANLDPLFDRLVFLSIDTEGARAVLSTIAGAMMTVISLVYSLTLVVFTLAASNIGPRLLKSFTNNRVNQITIGMLGATFLYALIVLYIVGDEEVPKLSVALAILMATVSFFWMIYFVHNAATRIMVDTEIGRCQRSLSTAIDRLLAEEGAERSEDRNAVPSGKHHAIKAQTHGYVTGVNVSALVTLAQQHEGFVDVAVRPGDFVIAGAVLAHFIGTDTSEDIADRVRRTIFLADSRAPEDDLQFNLHLIVEIALRALSPGINDPYTAITAVDHLSASLSRVLARGAPSALHRDEDGTPRVWSEIADTGELIGAALYPLRRGAQGNMLVTHRLIEALGRIRALCDPRHFSLLDMHLRMIAADARRAFDNTDDRRILATAIRKARAQVTTER